MAGMSSDRRVPLCSPAGGWGLAGLICPLPSSAQKCRDHSVVSAM